MKSCVLLLRILPFLLLPTLLPAAEEAPATSTAKVVDLRVESQTNPTAVNTPLPRFSWRIETEERGWLQKSYHILVASTPELLAQDKGDLWDSGEVLGRTSQFVSFGGIPLLSGQQIHWKVRSKDTKGTLTGWSLNSHAEIQLSGPASLPFAPFPADAQRISSFESSSSSLNHLYAAAAERLSELTGVRDVGLVMRAAGYHVALVPQPRNWVTSFQLSVDAAGFYPAHLPADGSFGSTQSDAGVQSAYALWWMTGDNAYLDRFWPTINAYGVARRSVDPDAVGLPFGTIPADSLPEGDNTPAEFLHLTSQALTIRLMLHMGKQSSRNGFEIRALNSYFAKLGENFHTSHLLPDGSLRYNSLTAHVLALRCGLLGTVEEQTPVAQGLLRLLSKENAPSPFEDSPLVATNILPVLTWIGKHDLGLKLAQAQDPDSLSPIALAAISEWLISIQAGINSELPGFQSLQIQPRFPDGTSLTFCKAEFTSSFGLVLTHSWIESGQVHFDLTIPPNTTAFVRLPCAAGQALTEGGKPIDTTFPAFVREDSFVTFRCLSGTFHFVVQTK